MTNLGRPMIPNNSENYYQFYRLYLIIYHSQNALQFVCFKEQNNFLHPTHEKRNKLLGAN